MTGRRFVATTRLTADEYARVRSLAQRRGLSVSALLRRGLNAVILDEGEPMPVLRELVPHSGGRKRSHAA